MSYYQTPDAILKTEPALINELGIKWWPEPHLTDYARNKGINDVHSWLVQFPDGRLMRLLTQNNEIICEDTTLEGIACHIDAMRMVKISWKDEEKNGV